MTDARPTPTEVAGQISRLANIMSDDDLTKLAEELSRDHRTLQQTFMRGLVWPLLKIWAEDYEANRYDLRNEDTVKLAHEIVTAFPDKGFRFV